MGRVIRSLFLIAIFIGLMVGTAKAQSFVVKFIDSDNSGSIDFKVFGLSGVSSSDYYTGAVEINSSISSSSLLIPAANSTSTFVSWDVPPGKSLLCNIYLTDGTNRYWTSQGEAVGTTKLQDHLLIIGWLDGNNKLPVFEFGFSKSDTFAIVSAVPIPSALWLLGPGAVALGLIRKKIAL